MQIGTQNVPFWESGCGELETGPQTGKIDPVEDFFPLIEAMPLAGLTQGAQVVQHLWMAVGSVEDWTASQFCGQQVCQQTFQNGTASPTL